MFQNIYNDLSAITYWNNSVADYIIALAIFIGLYLVFKLFTFVILKKLEHLAKKTKTQLDDIAVAFLKEIKWPLYVLLSLYLSTLYLNLHIVIERILMYSLLVIAGFTIANGVSKTINHIIELQIEAKKDQQSSSMLKVLGLIAKIVVWSIALLMILQNAGIEITPLIASLGIGGIAVALALQSVLADLFGAFVIYFDKPFKEGDFIIIGTDMGVVKHIGIKSTRIQALQGQELVMSNTELINSRVNNYKQMEKRRIVYHFGVKYDTGKTKLNKIKPIVNKLFEQVKGADLDRVNFKEFGDFSLNYEVVYYVNNSDYNEYMNTQEQLNLGLYDAFEKAKIEFAFPTQTIELVKK